MTGVDINKIRHYAPGFNNRTTRLDADMSALLFKAGTRVISSSERLIADVSIKAAMGAGAPADDKKEDFKALENLNTQTSMVLFMTQQQKNKKVNSLNRGLRKEKELMPCAQATQFLTGDGLTGIQSIKTNLKRQEIQKAK